jgi:hypothetical protein
MGAIIEVNRSISKDLLAQERIFQRIISLQEIALARDLAPNKDEYSSNRISEIEVILACLIGGRPYFIGINSDLNKSSELK